MFKVKLGAPPTIPVRIGSTVFRSMSKVSSSRGWRKCPSIDSLPSELLEPLDMKDTGFHVPKDKRHRFASIYQSNANGTLRLRDPNEYTHYRFPPQFLSGGGGLVSTARDYSHFVQMILNEGMLFGIRILSAESVRTMSRNHLSESADPIELNGKRQGVGFGLGFAIRVENSSWDSEARIGEFGWNGAASTHFWISPTDQLAVITLEQTQPYNWNLQSGLKGLIDDAIND